MKKTKEGICPECKRRMIKVRGIWNCFKCKIKVEYKKIPLHEMSGYTGKRRNVERKVPEEFITRDAGKVKNEDF